MEIALIGNPNSGKTMLFNELTGANQHVGNWPGVTVEQKRGAIRRRYGEGDLIDLPGIYSLSPFSMEEIVSRDYLVKNHPDVVINIVDATNLERNLYLSVQLIELNVPIVVALNMIDEVQAEGFQIDTERLAHDLGVPVVAISAARRWGIQRLMEEVGRAVPSQCHELPSPHLEHLIASTENLLAPHLQHGRRIGDREARGYPLHWMAIKVLEGDELVLRHLTLDDVVIQQIAELKAGFEEQHGLVSSAFAEARYRLIHHIIYHGVTVWSADGSHYHHVRHAPQGYLKANHDRPSELFSKPRPSLGGHQPAELDPDGYDGVPLAASEPLDRRDLLRQELLQHEGRMAEAAMSRTDAIDRVLTHRLWSLPIFLLLMLLIFHLTFSTTLFGIPGVPSPGVFLQDQVITLISAFSELLAPLFAPDGWAYSLVINGVVGGIGAVLSFVPQIILLFLFLTLLEDCGYIARAAFIMDRLLRRFGLSGKSFMPLLMGFGCTVPAAMAARTMENEDDRRLTLMLVPFMSCGARAPIFLVMAGAFFPAMADVVVFSMYLLGILAAVASGIILRKLLFKGEFSPFIIELPRYRLPQVRSVLLTLWDKLKGYLVRAGTIIFAMCVLLWLLSSFAVVDGSLQMVEIGDSFLAAFGKVIAPLFTPLGFGSWIAVVAIICGFISKETVISTLGTLLGVGGESALGGGILSAGVLAEAGFASPLAGLSFMVFCLLYVPCVAAFATLKKEFGSWKWAVGQAAWSVAAAYLGALAVYQLGGLLFA
ncbi:MAG: ferrous iron transport protein B [Actinomycetia bacterium]|nr:ferrous iron transport protein B [Actinomycetes bacterium]